MTTRKPRTFQRREGDNFLQVILASLLRSPMMAKVAMGFVLGGSASALVMRFMVIQKVDAQDAAHMEKLNDLEAFGTSLELQVEQVDRRVDTLKSSTGGVLRVTCLKTSRSDQELAEMDCPANLYLGAPR